VGSPPKGTDAPTVKLSTSDEPVATPVAVERGDKIGRFVVLETLGVGGMGVVVAAYDPELDRKVALKLLRPDVAPSEGTSAARARLLREAKAMAKLRHPSVVTVFEVGEFQGQVFLAMEYVPGTTLSQWCALRREDKGGWQGILAAFAEAGRGLRAAHERGLVHRDFKPANVLVGEDRVQVTDFGIASIDGRELVDAPRLQRDIGPEDPTAVSESGVVLGTAPYMAPELHDGSPADEKTDQFAFCVALFECLYGERPFKGDGTLEVSDSISKGRLQSPDNRGDVPDWVHKAILRGLAHDPDHRWPSMEELVDTLASPETAEVGRRVRVAIGVAIGLAFVAVPYVARGLGPPLHRSTYAAAVGQTLTLVAILLAMSYAARDLLRATAINRKAFAGVLAVLLMQIPLELGNAALGVPIVASDIQHMVLWAAMASMFGITTDRRFLALATVYLAGLPVALAWPEHHLAVLGATNGAFVVFVALIWRPGATPIPAAGEAVAARPDGTRPPAS
jgi:hypothetical protein